MTEMEVKNEKKLLILMIIGFQSRPRNSHNPKHEFLIGSLSVTKHPQELTYHTMGDTFQMRVSQSDEKIW